MTGTICRKRVTGFYYKLENKDPLNLIFKTIQANTPTRCTEPENN
jgi:hypothetical protein